MAPLWKGNIAFGLVTIPVQLSPAVQDKDLHFHLVSADGKCRLRRKLVCPETGKEVEYKDTARGFEVAPEQYVIVDPQELDKLQPASGRQMEIQQFVDEADIDPIYFQKPYYLLPDESGQKAYRLLVKALNDAKKVAVAKFVMREHEYLAALRPKDGALILETLYYADEIRAMEAPAANEKGTVDPRETRLALQLIETLSGPFDPAAYQNEYRERVQEMLDKLAKGQKLAVSSDKQPRESKVINLLDALEKSLGRKTKKQARASRAANTDKPDKPRRHAG